jgi:hypothetical protein
VCDGCALGTTGVRDWTLDGTHLCMVRLELMRLNTAGALDPRRARDVAHCRSRSSADLRASAGCRSRCCAGTASAASGRHWDEALIASPPRLRATDPQRWRSTDVARHHQRGLLRRAEGGAVLRHEPRRQLGAALPRGVDGRDEGDARPRRVHLQLSRLARRGPDRAVRVERRNNQPVTTKYLHDARQRGAQVAVVNPYREPGLERYWIPSIASSAIAGTAIADHWYRRAHRRRPRLPGRRASRRSSAGAVDAPSCATDDRCAADVLAHAARRRWDASSARAAYSRRRRGVRAPALERTEGVLRLVDGPDASTRTASTPSRRW